MKIIDVTFYGNDSMVIPNFDTIYTYSRNDSVFLFDKFEEEYGLLYDFGATVGDTIEFSTFKTIGLDSTFLAEITEV
ncbi:MAG: hypothetical protein R2879_05545 [Saprospiraceae bacterium]